jgi:hypothetical protein
MAMTLRLTEDEQAALKERAEIEGISMQARRAARDCVSQGQHRDRVSAAAQRVMTLTPTRSTASDSDGPGRIPRSR